MGIEMGLECGFECGLCVVCVRLGVGEGGGV